MRLRYQGKDITEYVSVVEAKHTDVSGGRCDVLEMTMEHAPQWHEWDPQPDDRIRVQMDGYDTEDMFLSNVLPEEGKYRIWASSLPLRARVKKWQSYENRTLLDILSACAAECGMSGQIYGINGAITYPYLIRRMETAPEFLSRIARMEGACLKAVGGRLVMIGIEYAQGLAAAAEIEIKDGEQGVIYLRSDKERWSGITLHSPWGQGSAQDSQGRAGMQYVDNLPVTGGAQANRWARGLLISNNRMCERLIFEDKFHPAMTAMSRVNIVSRGPENGQWLIEKVEHEFVKKTTRVEMTRVIQVQ